MLRASTAQLIVITLLATAGQVFAGSLLNPSKVYITEFASDTGNNEKFEFIEVTNLNSVSVNMSGWSEDDSNATPNKAGHILTDLGSLAPGQSGILTEVDPTAFRAYWNLAAAVKVVGGYSTDNLSTGGDSITLFDSAGTIVDRLDYASGVGDAGVTHATRTAPLSAVGMNNSSLWVNSALHDSYGSYTAAQGLAHVVGNPGVYLPATPVPAPSIIEMTLAASLLGAVSGAWRRRATAAC